MNTSTVLARNERGRLLGAAVRIIPTEVLKTIGIYSDFGDIAVARFADGRLFALNTEGVGTIEYDGQVRLYAHTGPAADGTIHLSVGNLYTDPITLEMLAEQYGRDGEVATFVREFGDRLDTNANLWARYLLTGEAPTRPALPDLEVTELNAGELLELVNHYRSELNYLAREADTRKVWVNVNPIGRSGHVDIIVQDKKS